MSFKQESIHLVAYNQHHQFYLTQSAKTFLVSVQKPIAIVTITGIYRTGKSYLINKLIKNKQNGFEMGSNVQATTKGLNIWGRAILAQDEKGNEIYYLVIDSEGIGSCQKQSKYDMKLLMLIFLISSTVVFNSMGAIDQMVLDQLRVILKIKDSLKNQQQKEKPKLVWILRYFSLQLTDRSGAQITPNQYLQNCLELLKGDSSQIRKKNEIRNIIKQGFRKRCCFTLVRPTIQQSSLADLTKGILRQQFLNQIQLIRQTIFSGSRQDLKIINGSNINGQILSKFLQECISKLNKNQRVQIKQISEYITKQYKQQLFDQLNIQMQKQISKLHLPMPIDTLKQKLNQIQNKFYKKIQEQILDIDDFKKYYRQFLKITNKINKELNNINKKLIKQKIIKQIKQFIKQNIDIQNVQPTNLSIVKVVIQRMQLKIKGQVQAYQLVLSILFSIMQVSQLKALSLQREVCQQRKLIQLWNSQRKNVDFNCLSIKRQLQQALQIINNLQLTQQQLQKQLALCKNQLTIQQNQLKSRQTLQTETITFLNKQAQQAHLKYKMKIQQQNQAMKKLREDNTRLTNDISDLKTQNLCQKRNQTKQFIFEEKIQQILTKKQNQIDDIRNHLNQKDRKYEQLLAKYDALRSQRLFDNLSHEKQINRLVLQQKQYEKQLQQIKCLHTQNKKTYHETLNVIKDNNRAFKNIENLSFSNSKLMTSCKKNNVCDQKQKQISRRYEDIIQKLKLEFEEKQLYMSEKVNKLTQSNDLLKKKCKEIEVELQRCKKDKCSLQCELLDIRQRFADNMSLIEMNKEKQRSFYQESIVRLLSTLDKKQSSRQYFTQKR